SPADLLRPPSFPTRRSSDLMRRLELLLPGDANVRENQMPAVADQLGLCECAHAQPPAIAGTTMISSPSRTVAWNPPCSRASSSRSEEHTSELQSLTNLVCRL